MINKPAHVTLGIALKPEADEQELEQYGMQLRDELLELDIESADFAPATEPAHGAKGPPADAATLLLTLAASGGVLTSVVGMLQSWITRDKRRSVTLEIGGDKLSITNVSDEDQTRLIRDWLSRHGNVTI